ncbi:uncharacterized protein LY89DRAFT_743382 [Mollisia scopiformis]|uniref:Uncharacterized protein n=1 Tax=Mollisia scopiformis TaxID=149040 RepID=A0A132B5W3_MOLSC|nr:uncharacterized protein LY89DRAFT_743382 [Mollisia scopiformis]KUJ07057.1 hypothetical protein LY89DRAFT_743382 [Mollisia scopiformis]
MASDDESVQSSQSSRSLESEDLENDADDGLAIIGKKTLAQLQARLKREGIFYTKDDKLPIIQGKSAPSIKGCLLAGDETPTDAFEEVANWCKTKNEELIEQLERRKLKTRGAKWIRVERLIQHEFLCRDEQEDESSSKDRKGNGKRKGRAGSMEPPKDQAVPKLDPEDVHHTVANLLVSALYNAVFFDKRTDLIAGYRPKGDEGVTPWSQRLLGHGHSHSTQSKAFNVFIQ